MLKTPQQGVLIARTLARAWRCPAPALDVSNKELAQITPLLLKSGAAALTWWRLTESQSNEQFPSDELLQAYRLHAVQSAQQEANLKDVFRLHRTAGIEPVLVKGWAIARHYPETGLRPYGDIDLFVAANEYDKADDVQRSAGYRYSVDHHAGSGKLNYLSFGELFEHSLLVSLDGFPIRVPCPEHHLRILSFHLLGHGVWRPLWLCDIAVALGSLPDDFDWDLCLGKNRRRRDWIACAVGLAHQLLGANIAGIPVEWRARHLPRWLVPSVLRQWSVPFTNHASHQDPMSLVIRRPRAIFPALRLRWPNPVEGTIGVSGPLNNFPRLPFQIGSCLLRSARFLMQSSVTAIRRFERTPLLKR